MNARVHGREVYERHGRVVLTRGSQASERGSSPTGSTGSTRSIRSIRSFRFFRFDLLLTVGTFADASIFFRADGSGGGSRSSSHGSDSSDSRWQLAAAAPSTQPLT